MGVRYLVTWNEILHSNDLARLHVLGPQVDGRQRKITRINVIPFLKVLCKLTNLTFTHKNLTTTTSGFRFHHWSNKGIWRWQAICSDPKEQNNDEKKGLWCTTLNFKNYPLSFVKYGLWTPFKPFFFIDWRSFQMKGGRTPHLPFCFVLHM